MRAVKNRCKLRDLSKTKITTSQRMIWMMSNCRICTASQQITGRTLTTMCGTRSSSRGNPRSSLALRIPSSNTWSRSLPFISLTWTLRRPKRRPNGSTPTIARREEARRPVNSRWQAGVGGKSLSNRCKRWIPKGTLYLKNESNLIFYILMIL